LPAGILAKKISEKEHIPFVVHAHSTGVLDNSKYAKYRDIILKSAHGYYAVSKTVQEKLLELGRKDTMIVPNFIDTKRFNIVKKSNKKLMLINISNFFKAKAIEVLLKAVNILVYEKKFTNVKLTIIGTGDYEEFYKSTAKELKLDDYVEFTGYVPNDKIHTYLEKSDILCVSSRRETFNIPLVEAMSCGIPGISTKCGGPEEIITKETGLLVPLEDPKAFANAILKMHKNYKNYNPIKIKEYVRNKYDKEVVCKDFIKKLECVISEYNKK
ncbi:MAG TPA: glycosyltransferase, partial [Bacilli bacterium]|nr:glycosyltransferase [Bacilli bacterium]